jgi:hypothetical protein
MAKNVPAADRLVIPTDNLRTLITADDLTIDHQNLIDAIADIETFLPDIPDRIDDDETSGEWQDVASRITAVMKAIEANRETVKAPYLTAGRAVDGFFKALEKRCLVVADKVRSPIAGYLRRKAEEERQRREQEAARAREEKARLQREADEARRREEAATRAATQAKHQQAATKAEAAADEAAHRASFFEREAQAKSADLSRTRSTGGSLATLEDVWDFEIADITKLKGAALWPFVTAAAKEAAVRAYIKANGPGPEHKGPWEPIDGVKFFRTTKLKVM